MPPSEDPSYQDCSLDLAGCSGDWKVQDKGLYRGYIGIIG